LLGEHSSTSLPDDELVALAEEAMGTKTGTTRTTGTHGYLDAFEQDARDAFKADQTCMDLLETGGYSPWPTVVNAGASRNGFEFLAPSGASVWLWLGGFALFLVIACVFLCCLIHKPNLDRKKEDSQLDPAEAVPLKDLRRSTMR